MPSLARVLYFVGVVLLVVALLGGIGVLAVNWVAFLIGGLVAIGVGYAAYGSGPHGYRRW